jgi:N12 class adenine-specific DNA methylase
LGKNKKQSRTFRKKKILNKKYCENNSEFLEKRRIYSKKYNEKNKDRIKEYNSRTKEYQKNINLKRRYNITEEEYKTLLESQQNCCDICKIKVDELCIDHCHKTGKIRSLLCHKCNTAIGLFSEDTKVLQNAIEYIQKHKKQEY